MRSSSARLSIGVPYGGAPGSDHRSRRRRASSATSLSVRSARSRKSLDCARWRLFFERTRSTTSAVPAVAPTPAATTGRTQLRGSRIDEISQASSSSAARSVSSVSVCSRRSDSRSGGSTGARARSSSDSNSGLGIASLMRSRLHRDDALELLDGTMDQHLRRAVGASHGTRDLAVVHSQREPHDQRLAAVVRKLLHTFQDSRQLVAALHKILGRVRRAQRRRVVDVRLRLARAVAVEVRREIVGDPDQPRPQRPAVALRQRPLEVPVGLQERLLRQVLGVVMVAHPVVGIRVHVAQVGLVELGELRIELGLVHASQPTYAAFVVPRPLGLVIAPVHCSASMRPASTAARPLSAGARTPSALSASASSGTASRPSAAWPSAGPISSGAMPRPSMSPARRLRLPSATTVATRSPTPASPANVSGRPPRGRLNASTSAKTLPAAAPAAFGPAIAAAAAATTAAFLAAAASSTPVTSVVVCTSRPAVVIRSASCSAKSTSVDATTSDAPWVTASAACPGPPRQATERACTRWATYAPGRLPYGAISPLASTRTPARAEIRSPWAATQPARSLAGTASTTRSARSSSSSGALATFTSSGRWMPGR